MKRLALLLAVGLLPGPVAARADWTATGQFRYRDRLQDLTGFTGGTEDRPIRFAQVEVVRSPNTTLATGTTDAAGNFSIPVVDGQTAAVFARVVSIATGSYRLRVQSSTNGTTTYAVVGAVVGSHNPGTNTDFGVITALSGAGGEAFNILDNLIDGSDYAASLVGALPSANCTTVWSSSSTTGTFYSSGVIRLLADEGWDDSVILHEHGHFIDLTYSATSSPGGIHFLGDNNQDIRLAWGEGVATYHMATAMRFLGRPRPTWYIDCTTGTGPGNLNFSYEIEGPSISAIGAGSEVSVQAVLYDIEDAAGDADATPGVDDDPLAESNQKIWNVMKNYLPSTSHISLEDFWDGWFSPGIDNGFLSEMRATFGALAVEYFPDAAEPDDDFGQARPINTEGVPVHQNFYGVGDDDWVSFGAPAPGATFILETRNLLGDANTNLEIMDTNGRTQLAANDDRSLGDSSSLLNWTAPAAGTYFARVTHAPDLGVYGSYDLRVLAGSAAGQAPVDVAAGAGVEGNRPGRGCAWGDFDGDGDADLFVSSAAGNAHFLFRNNGDGSFSDIAGSAGLTGSGISGQGACWGDYDNDGDLDLFLPGVGTNSLFRNNGNSTFTNVAAAAGVAYAGAGSLGGSWCDYDRDGRLDLFVGTLGAPDLLYRNGGDGAFTEVADALGVAGEALDSFGGVWGDYDADGYPDLFVHRDGAPNQLFHNDGGVRFTDATPALMIETNVRSWGANWLDYDHDGDFDLYVTNLGSPCRLYRNDGGAFGEVGAGAGVNASGSQTGQCGGDFDNDGDTDLYVAAYGEPNLYFENVTGAAFFNSGKAADNLKARGTACADYDGDGDLDIFVVNDNGPFRLFRSNAGGQAWIGLKLRGSASNRSAIGAVVTRHRAGGREARAVSGGGGYISQDDLMVHFGLGASSAPDTFDIRWPNGARSQVTGLARNQVYVISETDSLTPARPVLAAFTATPVDGGVRLTWQAPRGDDRFVGWIVERREPGGGVEAGWVARTARAITSPAGPAGPRVFEFVDTELAAGSPLEYRVVGLDRAGGRTPFAPLSITPRGGSGGRLWLSPGAPNPFSVATVLSVEIPAGSPGTPADSPPDVPVRLDIFDARGRLVRRLLDEARPPGAVALTWDGHDDAGGRLPAGLYFARLAAPGGVQTRKILLQR